MSEEAIKKIKDKFGDAVLDTHSMHGDDTARVEPNKWLDIVGFAKDELGFRQFIDLTAVDYLGIENGLPRFEVVLHLRNLEEGKRIRLKARLSADAPSIESLVPLYKGANWFERECHEMYGVKFKNHPDLRPLLLYKEFKGYPLRKDYPIDKRQPIVPLIAPEERRFPRPMDETPHGHDPRFIDEEEK